MRRLHLLLALGLALAALAAPGCRGRRSVRGDVGSGSGGEGGGVSVGGGTTVAHGTPREMLDQYDAVMRGAGYEPVGPVTQNVLPPNGITPLEIDVRRGYCYSLAVFGAAGTNVDLVVLDPRGAQIAHDVHTDEHPWVTFCAARGGRFVARIQQVVGEGEFFFAPYHARGRTRADLSAFFGAAVTDTAVAATLDPETQGRIAALDSTLGTENFRRAGDASGEALAERAERLFSLTLEPGNCYAFATFGGPGAADTDVYLVDGDGHWLAQDARSDRDAMVRFCPTSHGTYNLQVRLLRGSGPVFTAAYLQASAGAAGPAPDDLPVISDTSTAGVGVDENFALLDADMRARGYEAYGSSARGELSEAGSTAYDVDLEGGKCYAILAVGDSGVRNLDLTLLDGSGREVDRDDAPDTRPIVRVCPSANGHYRMQVRMTAGTGAYFYAAYRWPRGIRGPFGLEGLIYVRLAELTQLLSVEGYSPDPGYDLEQGRLRTEGASATHTLRLAGGQCYSIAVVGGDGTHDIDVSLARSGTEVASDMGVRSAFSSVRRCVESETDFTLTVRAGAGSGPYLYQVFSRASSPSM